jgi:D-alanyl-lipoteichoic acid acyltransferase DltB (MBOAT superfamily)
MLFTEAAYWVFLPVVLILYWLMSPRRRSAQNQLLLASSYFFYGCWDWRFLFLLLFSTALDFGSGLLIDRSQSSYLRRIWLWVSIGTNLAFLGYFKYCNFFLVSFTGLLSHFGLHSEPIVLSIILPVGISFYTFHGLSYVIDVYYRRLQPEQNFVDYALFVSYFPLLVAGPIERASHLLPQLKSNRVFNYAHAVSGLRQILWGLFKKIVIADQCGGVAAYTFEHYQHLNGTTLLMGCIMFSFQIYGDFSGYSDIASGTSRLFGIELLRNFSYPYFSRDMAEFWRRWHISLSSWFRDYVYVPLGGSKGSIVTRIRNTFIIFLLSGFWHGAGWNFLFWGFLNALFIMPSILLRSNRKYLDIAAANQRFPSVREVFSIGFTFLATTFCWIFFRAPDIGFAFDFIGMLFRNGLFHRLDFQPYKLMLCLLYFFYLEWIGRHQAFALQSIEKFLPYRWMRFGLYYVLILLVYHYTRDAKEFIYFQF